VAFLIACEERGHVYSNALDIFLSIMRVLYNAKKNGHYVIICKSKVVVSAYVPCHEDS
jgi:hypothetical protein